MNTGGVKLVCFDLGRVLIRIVDDWSQACHRAGIAWSDRDDPYRARPEVRELFDGYECGRVTCDDLCEQAAALSDGRLTAVDIRRIGEAWLIGPYDGIEPLLDELDASGVETACLSNTSAMHWAKMTDPSDPASLPLHRLTHRFASQLIGVAKPDPAIYEHVERVTGCAGPRIVFFDDLQENIDAALARRWLAKRIDPAVDDPIAQVRLHLRALGVLQ
jgi:FMN phosphatase YigB (HAD superfamily)